MEVTYEYVKGQGWVPTTKPKPQKWACVFWDEDINMWRNANRYGYHFDTYEEAYKRRLINSFKYDVWPAEREQAEGYPDRD